MTFFIADRTVAEMEKFPPAVMALWRLVGGTRPTLATVWPAFAVFQGAVQSHVAHARLSGEKIEKIAELAAFSMGDGVACFRHKIPPIGGNDTAAPKR